MSDKILYAVIQLGAKQYLIKEGDKIVADSIIELLKNEEYAKTLGMNARMRLESDFKWGNQLKVIGKWI